MTNSDLAHSVIELILVSALSRAEELEQNLRSAAFGHPVAAVLRQEYPRALAAVIADTDYQLARRELGSAAGQVRLQLRAVQDSQDIRRILADLKQRSQI